MPQQMTLEQLLAKAKAIPGFDDEARQLAPARELSRDARFQDIADEQKDFGNSSYNPAKGMRDPSNPELLGGSPALNKAIDAATAVRDITRMPNTPWWMPSLSTVGEGELGAKALGLAGRVISPITDPIMGGIWKVTGAIGDMFGGGAEGIGGSQPSTSFSKSPGEAGTFHPAQPHPSESKPIVSPEAGYGFRNTVERGLGKSLDKIPTAGADDLAGIDEAIANQEKAGARSRAMNAKNGPGNVNDVRDYTANPEPDDADAQIRDLVEQVKAGKRDIGGRPAISSDETTGSLFREHNPNRTSGVGGRTPDNTTDEISARVFGPENRLNPTSLQSPLSALASHESGDVLSLPRSKFTQGMGRGFERGGAGPLVSSHGDEGALAGINSASKMTPTPQTMKDLEETYGLYETKGNGGFHEPTGRSSSIDALREGDEPSKRSVMYGGAGVGDRFPKGPRVAQSFFDKVKKLPKKK